MDVYAVNDDGVRSATDSITFVVIVLSDGCLHLNINGAGSVSPSYYTNVWLTIGASYSVTGTPADGVAFPNWTDGNGLVLTNGPTLQFAMQFRTHRQFPKPKIGPFTFRSTRETA